MGSEMCIRDRCDTQPLYAKVEKNRKSCGDEQVDKNVVNGLDRLHCIQVCLVGLSLVDCLLAHSHGSEYVVRFSVGTTVRE